MRVTAELARVNGHESNRELVVQSNRREWNHLYFQEPFTLKEALQLLSECVEEALKSGVLEGSNTCDIERVVSYQENPT